MNSKICKGCNTMKPLDEYYRDARLKDGRDNYCKICQNKARREYERRRKASGDIDYILREREEGRTKYLKHKNKQKSKSNPQSVERYIARHPQKHQAHTLVREAITKGILVKQPCCICGETNTSAHHEDYNKPLDVIWYCTRHHHKRHVELRESELIHKYSQSA